MLGKKRRSAPISRQLRQRSERVAVHRCALEAEWRRVLQPRRGPRQGVLVKHVDRQEQEGHNEGGWLRVHDNGRDATVLSEYEVSRR
jgi:hypothetical protein